MKKLALVAFLLLPVFSAVSTTMESFPFRRIEKGATIPDVTLKDLEGNDVKLSDFTKGVAIILFWGADSEIKKRHSLNVMKGLIELGNEIKDVKIVAIDTQGDPIDVIKNATSEINFTYPVLIDAERKVYGTFGIFVMPSVAIVKDNILVEGLAYTHNLVELAKGEVEVALGLKTREQLEEERKSKVVEKSKERLEAERLYHLGSVMRKRGMLEAAEDALKKAISSDDSFGEAHIELAHVYIEMGRLDEAEKELQKGLSLVPESLEGKILLARLKASKGLLQEALDDLRILIFKSPRNPELYYSMGEIYEKMGNYREASESYKKAFKLLSGEE